MIRKILVISLVILTGMLCLSQNAATKATLRLKHLPADAPMPEVSKYVTDIMTRDANPLNYLPIVGQLDSLTVLLGSFESMNSIGLEKFTADLHTLADAIEILDHPYNGESINAVTDSIDHLTFFTESQKECQEVDSIFKSVKQYYGITTNLQELLDDMINGKERYMAAATEEEKSEILNEIDEMLMFDNRNERISRIPYLKSQLDIVFQSCPRDEAGNLLPESFDTERLQALYDANEQARSTRSANSSPKDKSNKNNKKK